MKFITVRDLRTTPAKIWKDLPEEQEMVITNNGKPIALLTPLSGSDIENTISSIRKIRASVAISNMQYSSIKNNLSNITLEEIQKEIKATRKNK